MASPVTSERGMTMVELLVGSAVMITVLGVTTGVLTQSSRVFTQQRAAMTTRNNSGAAIDMLVRLLRQSSCLSDKDVYCQSILPDPDNNNQFDSVRVRGDWNPRDGAFDDPYEDVLFVVATGVDPETGQGLVSMLFKREPTDQALVAFGNGVQSIQFAYTDQNGGAMTVATAKARPDLITGVTITVVSTPPHGLVPITSASTISVRRKK